MLKNSLLKKLLKNFTLISLFCFTLNISADNQAKYKNYQIELILFKNNIQTSQPELPINKSEQQIIPDDAINLADVSASATDTDQAPKILSEHELLYSNIYKKLNNDRNYTVLSHIGWLQPKKNINKSKPLYFQLSGKKADGPDITAVIKFNMQKYLHAKISLSYKTSLQNLLINESRRLRSKELNYLDHPEFGAILVATEK